MSLSKRIGCKPGEIKFNNKCFSPSQKLFKTVYDKYDGKYGDLVEKYVQLLEHQNKKYLISKNSAVASITALRNFNAQLENQAKEYATKPGYGSHIQSIRRFQKLAKDAFDELQKMTGDKTPWKIKW